MQLSEDFNVLASFDPGTFLLQFLVDPNANPEDARARQLTPRDLIGIPLLSTASHEFAHFVQGCATSSGIREFFLALDLAQAGYLVLEAAAQQCNGTLSVPIVENIELYGSSDHFKKLFTDYLVIARTCLLYIGGQAARRDRAKHDTDQSWLKVEEGVRIFNTPTAVPLFFADMNWISGDPRLVLLGSIHLSEAFAKGIEMVQRRLTGEPGMAAEPGGVPRDADSTQFPLANPYFIAHWIYGHAIKSLPQDAWGRASIEELCAIIDLSLMLDPVVTASVSAKQGEFGAFWSKHRPDYSPMHAFMFFLSVLQTEYRELPMFTQEWRQEQVTSFQNALLEKAGFSISILDLARAALAWVEQAFELVSANGFLITPPLLAEYQRSFRSFLRWRIDTLNGGAVLEDLLTGVEQFYEFVLSTVPAFAIGPLIVSPKGGVRPGEGIGVDIGNLHQYRSVIQALISGNVGCPLHTDKPRCCAVPPHDYCRALPTIRSGLERCTRETVLNALLMTIGVSQLAWKDWTRRGGSASD